MENQSSANLNLKKSLFSKLHSLAECQEENLSAQLKMIFHKDAVLRGSHPINEMQGLAEIEKRLYSPLKKSFPDLERRDSIFISGSYRKDFFIGAVGFYAGTFKKPWLGIPDTGRTIYLRYGEFYKIENGKIRQANILIDILDLLRQIGIWPLPPSLGIEQTWPAPFTGDGVTFRENDAAVSQKNLDFTLAMHKSINEYDDTKDNSKEALLHMEQKNFWHPKMMWYGPAGIGSTRGLLGYIEGHQHPFRLAFPNRKAIGHYTRIADGSYTATSGWPSVHAKHLGGNWLGTSPSGKDIFMRVMDFYLIHEGLLRENWIPLDIIHVLLQMDIDIFARLHQLHKPYFK